MELRKENGKRGLWPQGPAMPGGVWRRIISIVLCAALLGGVLGGCAGCQGREQALAQVDAAAFTVAPSAETDGLIPQDAQFNVTYAGKESLSAEQLLTLLEMSPQRELAVEKKKKNQFVLTPGAPFAESAIVNLHLKDAAGLRLKSWAFQTATGFAVKGTLPDDGAGYAPTTSGVEIEFTLADVAVEEFMAHFSISPAVEGSAKKFGSTVAFVPAKGLEPSTIYTVTLDKGLKTPGGTALGEDYSFSFRTAEAEGSGKTEGYFENYSPIAETFAAGDAPLIAINCDERYQGRDDTFDVEIYRFKSAQDYAAELSALAQKRNETPFKDSVEPEVDLGRLDSLGTQQVALTSPSDGNRAYWGPIYLLLPGEYAPGWYYIRVRGKNPITGREVGVHKFIQVSGLSVYYLQTQGDTLFWLNNTETGAPVTGAKVAAAGAQGESGQDGVAALSVPVPQAGAPGDKNKPPRARDQKTTVFTIEQGGATVYADFYSEPDPTPPTGLERYVAYLYTDRPIYMSTDTVRCWGVVRPRAGVKEPPQNLRVTLGGGEEPYYSTPVTLRPDGTFTAEISFENFTGRDISYYNPVSLCCEKAETLSTQYVSIGDYVKPAYSPAASHDKVLYQAGEMAQIEFSAAFFDGTPVFGFAANVGSYEGGGENGQSYDITTGEDGKAVQPIKIPLTVRRSEPNDWRPYWMGYYVNNAEGEGENFSIYNSFPVLFRDAALLVERVEEEGQEAGDGKGDGARVKIRTYRIDPTKIKVESDLYDAENLLGAPLDTTVRVELHKVYTTRAQIGSYYDFIRKENVPYYEDTPHNDVVSTTEYRAEGGVLEVGGLPKGDAQASYYVGVWMKDLSGRDVYAECWLGYGFAYYGAGLDHYYFSEPGAQDEWQRAYQFEEGKPIELDLLNNGRLVEQGKVFYAVVQQGVTDRYVRDIPKAEVPFDEKLVPNFKLAGAYFDGKYVFDIEKSALTFDSQQRALEVKVSADREKYAPGDTARLEVAVTYRGSGEPAAGAALSVSLVDEAVFAIEDRTVDPLEELYKTAFSRQIKTYASYRQYDFLGMPGAEKGGGGGDEGVRSDFKDTAAFLTATADEAGRATLEVPLPDNITSWRATVQAVSSDLCAGFSEPGVIVTGRFFLLEVLPAQFLAGDNAVLPLRAYGSAITSESPVEYTVSVEPVGGGDKTEAKGAGKAAEYTYLPLGTLKKGSYTVTMTAKSGEVQDAVQKTVDVLESGVEASVSKTFALEGALPLEPAKFPAVLGFYNADYETWAQVLDYVNAHSWGSRADERIARKFAQDTIAALWEEGEAQVCRYYPTRQDDLGDVVDESGYVSLFSYATPDVKLAARAHLAALAYIKGRKRAQVFYSVLGMREEGAPEEIAAAYLGLAAHKEPVLGQVRDMLSRAEEYPFEAQLYLTAALAALGDSEGAGQHYDKLIAPRLTTRQREDKATEALIDAQGDIDESLRLTALASLTASMARRPEADAMMRYLINNRPTLDLTLLEQLVYLQYMQPQGAQEAKVSYSLRGEKQTVSLRGGMHFARFMAPDLDTIKAEGGNVWCKAYYIGGAQEAQSQENRDITLTRTIEAVDGGGMQNGGIVKITVTPQIADTVNPGGMLIDDFLPAGLRYLSMSGSAGYGKSYGSGWALQNREGQRLSFLYCFWTEDDGDAYYDPDTGEVVEPRPGEKRYGAPSPLVYYARCAMPGTYVCDSAFARTSEAPLWGSTERTAISIDE